MTAKMAIYQLVNMDIENNLIHKEIKKPYTNCNEYISEDDQDTPNGKRKAEDILLALKPSTNVRKRKSLDNSVKKRRLYIPIEKETPVNCPIKNKKSISDQSSDLSFVSIQSSSELSSPNIFTENSLQQCVVDGSCFNFIPKPYNIEGEDENYSIESSSESNGSSDMKDLINIELSRLARIESVLPLKIVESETGKSLQCLPKADVKPIKGGLGQQLENALKLVHSDALIWKYTGSILADLDKTKSFSQEDHRRCITKIEKENNCVLLFLNSNNNNNDNKNLMDIILLHSNEKIVSNLSVGNLITIEMTNTRNCIINNKRVFFDMYKIKFAN